MAIEDVLAMKAKVISDRIGSRLARLLTDLDELEQKKREIEAECEAVRGAPERLLKFRPKIGADYFCPDCWIKNERRSTMRPVPSGLPNVDIMRCNACSASFEVYPE